MGLEASIKTALASVAGGRVYPDVTPDDTLTYPLVIYQQVGGDVLNPLDGADPNMDHARVQVWVWSKTRLATSTTMRQARIALTSGSLKAYAYAAPVSNFDDVLKLYGARTDFGVWFTP